MDVEPEAPRDEALHAARLLHGSPRGYVLIQGSGIQIPKVPPFEPLYGHHDYSGGEEETAQELPVHAPEIPAIPPYRTEGHEHHHLQCIGG